MSTKAWERRQLRRALRDADPTAYAVLQSVEEARTVHIPWSAEAEAQLKAVANAETIPSPGSKVFVGARHDGLPWAVRLDDVPEGGA